MRLLADVGKSAYQNSYILSNGAKVHWAFVSLVCLVILELNCLFIQKTQSKRSESKAWRA